MCKHYIWICASSCISVDSVYCDYSLLRRVDERESGFRAREVADYKSGTGRFGHKGIRGRKVLFVMSASSFALKSHSLSYSMSLQRYMLYQRFNTTEVLHGTAALWMAL